MFHHLNIPLISAFVERWHLETNTFHMPFGEMSITLHDVFYILRISVTGKPIITKCDISTMKMHLEILLDLPFEQIKAMWKSGTIKFSIIEERLSGDHMQPEFIARGYLLWLLGGTLFVDKSTDSVHVHFLPFLRHLGDAKNYAWGAAALAFLYRQLRMATWQKLPRFQHA